MTPEFRPADRFSLAELAALWRAAYAGYYVPLAFDEVQLARHILWSGLDLSLSLVGLADGEAFGLSLAARDGDEAWIGGFGVAPAWRRRGLATRLIAAQTTRLDAAGVKRTRLEVIDVNPAREVYRGAGFAETRPLLVLEGALAGRGDAGVAVDATRFAQAHARLHAPAPTSWRRKLDRLRVILSDQPAFVVGVERDGAIAAFAVVLDHPERFGVFDAAAADETAAHALLSALAAERPGAHVRIVDEPDGTPLARVLLGKGFTEPLRQVEMERLA